MLSLRALFRVYAQNHPSSTQKPLKTSARALYSSSRSSAKVKNFAAWQLRRNQHQAHRLDRIEGGEAHQAQSEANPESCNAALHLRPRPASHRAAATIRRPRIDVAQKYQETPACPAKCARSAAASIFPRFLPPSRFRTSSKSSVAATSAFCRWTSFPRSAKTTA